jgi:hypothetical protein
VIFLALSSKLGLTLAAANGGEYYNPADYRTKQGRV